MRTTLWILTCVSLSGCLNHPNMRVESAVTLEDMNEGVRGQDTEGTVFRGAQRTTGRFPAGISIVRLIHCDPEEDAAPAGALKIFPPKPYEGAYWAELFDGTPEVLRMVLLHEKSVRATAVTREELLTAAKVNQTGLLLMYGFDNTSDYDACHVNGLLYEIPSGKLIASLRHTATRDDAEESAVKLPENDRPETEEDWAFYIDFVAFRGFEKRFRDCIWHLIDIDGESDELQPNPFKGVRPVYPQPWRTQPG